MDPMLDLVKLMAVVFTDLAECRTFCDVESGYSGRGRVMCRILLGKGC